MYRAYPFMWYSLTTDIFFEEAFNNFRLFGVPDFINSLEIPPGSVVLIFLVLFIAFVSCS